MQKPKLAWTTYTIPLGTLLVRFRPLLDHDEWESEYISSTRVVHYTDRDRPFHDVHTRLCRSVSVKHPPHFLSFCVGVTDPNHWSWILVARKDVEHT